MQPTDATKILQQRYDDALSGRKRSGLLRELATSAKTGLDFTHNDYLGLSRHPLVVRAAIEAAETYGTGGRASRLLGAEAGLIRQLESEISAAKSPGTDRAALIFPSGFQLNSGVLATLLDKSHLGDEPAVLTDRLIHASLHAGIAGAGVRQQRFSHNDVDHLESLLRKNNDQRPRFVIIESVYSMDGDIAPLKEIYRLKAKYGFQLYVDEAHATGVAGENGYGLAKCVEGEADLVVGTFSKALGSTGGYIVARTSTIQLLVNFCTAFVYSTAPSPVVVAAARAAWNLLPQLDSERSRLRQKVAGFRSLLNARGFDTGASETNIVPIMMSSVDQAAELHLALAESDIHVGLIRPPTVPPDGARLRAGICATHSESDMTRLTEALCRK